MTSVENHYDRIMRSSLFRRDGKDLDWPAEFTKLAHAVRDDPRSSEDLSSVGEFTECDLWDLLVAAYWSFVHCHGGQWTPEYAAQCAIGEIYSPGCEHAPSEGDPTWETYNALCEALCPNSSGTA